MALGDEFKGLPMADLIGAPLTAACDSNLKLAQTTAQFIETVGFQADDKGKPTNEIRTAKFSYNVMDANNTTQKVDIDVPLLTIVQIPSLKDRGNDVVHLAKNFVEKFCKEQRIEPKSFTPDAIRSIMDYDWPGNVRELKSMVERAALVSDTESIGIDDLIFLEQKVA